MKGHDDNAYVHHDILLPAFPLCVEWIDKQVTSAATGDKVSNLLAVGTFEPDIEIWNLDTIDLLYPDLILGQHVADKLADSNGTAKKKKPKATLKQKVNDSYHVDAVISLASNHLAPNLLVSGSADTTIKLWDIETETCKHSYTHHKDKVGALAWHPTEATILLSGGSDKLVIASDVRTTSSASTSRQFKCDADVEGIQWDPTDPNFFYVATEDGMLSRFDVRKTIDSCLATPCA